MTTPGNEQVKRILERQSELIRRLRESLKDVNRDDSGE